MDRFTVGDLPPVLAKLNAFSGTFDADEIKSVLDKSYPDADQEVDFETFLRVIVSSCLFYLFDFLFFNQLLMDGFRIGLPKCASPGSRKIRRVQRFFLIPQN